MNRADGIERDRWASREAEMSRSERVNITEDVRKYAAENAVDESTAVEHGLRSKAAEYAHSPSDGC